MTRAILSKPGQSLIEQPWLWLLAFTVWQACLVPIAGADAIQLLRQRPDPYGYPRPAPGETHVPVATSYFFQIGFPDRDTTDTVLADSVAVQIGPQGEPPVDVLRPGRQFANGYSGKFISSWQRRPALAVYIDGQKDLRPSTTYVVTVRARSREGAVLSGEMGSWQFTTQDAPSSHALRLQLDLSAPPVRWHGGFFTGFCKPSFCTSAANRIASYELMDQLRKQYPKAWNLQRDIWPTGTEHQPEFLRWELPNAVRERETRRIVAMERHDKGTLLRVEDFFGHQQYGIAADRPLTGDYHLGDEILIADGVNHAWAKVVRVVDDSLAAKSLLVTSIEQPADGWRIPYAGSLPEKESPDAPGLFPPGGCYLRKFRPAGTPHYYWKRLDKEWDIVHGRFGRRLVVNFCDAPGDLSVDGRNWTYPKDYAEYHEVVRAYTDHLIERYGDACLDFYWSAFNEPDLAAAFWRSGDWNELQKFYDYTVDAVCRAFEDQGYDSNRVVVGGLELGAIFGTHLERPVLRIFLSHCSPTANFEGALPQNAAFVDKRLDGKRSRRIENLCRTTGGKGTPCDFISIHSYNASQVTAAKLIRAKEIALETDAAYYDRLWVNSFESCPNWSPPPDVAAADSYLGNGYFPTWCADVTRRLLFQASQDQRYALGETILTFWPWPNSNFAGLNDATRVIAVDDDGDGQKDREVAVAMPILNFLGLLSAMGETYWVLPEQSVGPHIVSGFASQQDDAVRIVVYSHNWRDTQSRSQDAFQVTLDLSAVPWSNVQVSQFRFDQVNNSYFHLGRQLRDRPTGQPGVRLPGPDEVERLMADLASGDRAAQIAALKKAVSFGEVPEGVASAAIQLYEETKDQEVRSAIEEAVRQISVREAGYRPDEVARIRELSMLQVTQQSRHAIADGALRLPLAIAANGADFVVISPAPQP